MSIECDQVRENMSLWFDGRLATAETRNLRAHVRGCPSCWADLDAMCCVDRTLSAAPTVSPAPGFVARFQYRRSARRNRRRTMTGLILLTLATTFLLLVGVGLLTISSLWAWQGATASLPDLFGQVFQSLVVVGRAIQSVLNLALVMCWTVGRVLSHPLFVGYIMATALLVAAWAWIAGIRPRAYRAVRA